ncbi:uncharacterized protein LOC105696420 isoform X2 [Orussus abietinus]|uniref:uncharacterized protein LOC105696420 isoform X2 n=1 Tax=Orussus abietinus TaxID=222816 RepID=UPI0006251A79|nr:uncharacterized protein LOC105696420 isoform X2 [Orussus abietinus]
MDHSHPVSPILKSSIGKRSCNSPILDIRGEVAKKRIKSFSCTTSDFENEIKTSSTLLSASVKKDSLDTCSETNKMLSQSFMKLFDSNGGERDNSRKKVETVFESIHYFVPAHPRYPPISIENDSNPIKFDGLDGNSASRTILKDVDVEIEKPSAPLHRSPVMTMERLKYDSAYSAADKCGCSVNGHPKTLNKVTDDIGNYNYAYEPQILFSAKALLRICNDYLNVKEINVATVKNISNTDRTVFPFINVFHKNNPESNKKYSKAIIKSDMLLPVTKKKQICLSSTNFGQRKRRPKRNNDASRLQALLKNQLSFLRLWQYQISHTPSMESSCTRYVLMTIYAVSTEFSRQFLECFVVKDSWNLLTDPTILYCYGEKMTTYARKIYKSRIIILIANPSVAHVVPANSGSFLKLYPPWKVINWDECVLSAQHFDIHF